jgi:hypothetical protein
MVASNNAPTEILQIVDRCEAFEVADAPGGAIIRVYLPAGTRLTLEEKGRWTKQNLAWKHQGFGISEPIPT